MNKKIELELKRLTRKKEELTQRLAIVESNIALLHKLAVNGKGDEIHAALGLAALEAMEEIKENENERELKRFQKGDDVVFLPRLSYCRNSDWSEAHRKKYFITIPATVAKKQMTNDVVALHLKGNKSFSYYGRRLVFPSLAYRAERLLTFPT